MKTIKQMQRKSLVACLLMGLYAVSGSATAARPGETLGNNLSVPAKFVPNTTGAPALRISCGTYAAPGDDGQPSSVLYPGYWLQKTLATWSADCIPAAESAEVTADWGDNLTTSEGRLTAGRPIRVEVGLLDLSATGLRGFAITKLTPDLEDRLATYGTRGEPDDAFATGDANAPATRVWDAGARLKIERLGTPITTVFEGPMTAEINSGGSVVYGFNWGTQGRTRTPTAGNYRLTFTTSEATTITGVADLTGNIPEFTDHGTTVVITILPRSRGGRP